MRAGRDRWPEILGRTARTEARGCTLAALKLWTVQRITAANALTESGRLAARWPRTQGCFAAAYRWMADLMTERGIVPRCEHPVWAWHSCGGYAMPPGAATFDAFLSEDERVRHRHVLLELRVPDEHVLLSSYGPWNEIVDLFVGLSPMSPDIPAALRGRLLELAGEGEVWGEDNRRDIQASLPFVDAAWVRGIVDV